MVKAYIWFIIVLFVISALGRLLLFFYTDKVSYVDLIEALIGLIASVGLFGYLRNQYFISSYFWVSIIFVGVSLGIYNNLFSGKAFELVEKIGFVKAALTIGLSYAITAPCLYFLFLYAKSKNF